MKQNQDAAWRSLCAELRPGDGVPPHIQKRKEKHALSANNPHGAHRFRQYSKAVRRVLDSELASFPGASGLSVAAVVSQSSGAVLLVIVRAPAVSMPEVAALESALQSASGTLRAAIAGEVNRRRVPHLRFRVVPDAEGA